MNLQDFEAEEAKRPDGRRRRCITCSLPEEIISEIHRGRAREPKPVAFEMIAKWVESETGRKIQPNTIRNHFVAKHHE